MVTEDLKSLTRIGDFAPMERKQSRQLTWKTPESRQEGTERARILLDEINRIDVQLSSTSLESYLTKRKPDGSSMTEADYEFWRKRAKQARGAKMSEYRFLKEWLANNPPVPTRNWLQEVMHILDSLDSMVTEDMHGPSYDQLLLDLMDLHTEYRGQKPPVK